MIEKYLFYLNLSEKYLFKNESLINEFSIFFKS